MTRRRWYDVEWSISASSLAQKLMAHSFRAGSDDGFVLDQLRDDFISGSYFERIQQVEKVTDPFGQEYSYARTEFRRSEFRISEGASGLELIDPNRSAQRLISRLLEASNFDLTLKNIDVDPYKWGRAFQTRSPEASRLEFMQIGGIGLPNGSEATVIVKGSKDVALAAFGLIGDVKSFSVEKVRLRYDRSPGIIALSNKAGVHLNVPSEKEVLPDLRRSLLDVR